LKLISAALAGYGKRNDPNVKTWQGLCRTLSKEMKELYLRALFLYFASGDWSDVLAEKDLNLGDRLAVSLRFLEDDEVCANFLSFHAQNC
jgi:hypothetical protein